MGETIVLSTISKTRNGERKVFYYEDNIEKPILAAGILLFKEDTKEVLVQKLPKDDTYQFSDFGGKIDMEDKNVIESIARELWEEINGGICRKKNGKMCDLNGLKKLIHGGIKKKLYFPNAKYFLIFVSFNENKYELNMDKIGEKEETDQITRNVVWIPYQEFIDSHFSHNLHPRLWGKSVLEFFGYEGEIIPQQIKKFAFV